MPKKAVSAREKQNEAFLAALRVGQAWVGDSDVDTAKLLGCCYTTFWRRKKAPGKFEVDDLRTISDLYHLKDYQVCQIIGVEYHGRTMEQEAV